MIFCLSDVFLRISSLTTVVFAVIVFVGVTVIFPFLTVPFVCYTLTLLVVHVLYHAFKALLVVFSIIHDELAPRFRVPHESVAHAF